MYTSFSLKSIKMELTIVSGCMFPESCKHPGCGTSQGGEEARALAVLSTRGLWKYSKSRVIQPLSHRSLSAQCPRWPVVCDSLSHGNLTTHLFFHPKSNLVVLLHFKR